VNKFYLPPWRCLCVPTVLEFRDTQRFRGLKSGVGQRKERPLGYSRWGMEALEGMGALKGMEMPEVLAHVAGVLHVLQEPATHTGLRRNG
jgi:hypothetical protein